MFRYHFENIIENVERTVGNDAKYYVLEFLEVVLVQIVR